MGPAVPIAIGMGLGGAAANYYGGRKAARAKQRAISRWQRDRQALLEQMGLNRWEAGRDRAGALTETIQGMTPAMQSAETPTPSVSVQAPAEHAQDQDWLSAYLSAADESGQVANAELAADASEAQGRRGRQALADTEYRAGVTARAKAPQRSRREFTLQEAIAAVDAELARAGVPDSAYGWQGLGALLNAGSQGLIYSGARS
jgi:hypothetical protein